VNYTGPERRRRSRKAELAATRVITVAVGALLLGLLWLGYRVVRGVYSRSVATHVRRSLAINEARQLPGPERVMKRRSDGPVGESYDQAPGFLPGLPPSPPAT
jgi:hypothetical protein